MRRLLLFTLLLLSSFLCIHCEDETFTFDPDEIDFSQPFRFIEPTPPSPLHDLPFFSGMPDMESQLRRQISAGTDEDRIDERLFNHLLENAPYDIQVLISTLQNTRLQSEWPHAVLLEGKPGVGKSTYAKVIAQAVGRPFVFIKTSTLANEYQHSGSQNIERLFQQLLAMAAKEPLVVIFDEINAITDSEKQKRQTDKNCHETFWMWMDKCSRVNSLLIIGTTNDATNMREQLISRFDGDIITIAVPDSPDVRKQIIEYHLQNRAHNLDARFVANLAKKTRGFAPRALEKLIIKARQYAALKNGEQPVIDQEDIHDALENYYKGRDRVTKPFYKRWGKDFLKYGVPAVTTFASVCTIGGFIMSVYYRLFFKAPSSIPPALARALGNAQPPV